MSLLLLLDGDVAQGGHFLVPYTQVRLLETEQQPRPIDHVARFALFAGRTTPQAAPQRVVLWTSPPVVLEAPAEIRSPAHAPYSVRQQVQAAPQRLWLWQSPPSSLAAEPAQLEPPDNSALIFWRTATAAAPAAPQRLPFWSSPPSLYEQPAEIRPVTHAPYSNRPAVQVPGHFLTPYTQVRLAPVDEPIRPIDHATRFALFGKTAAPAQAPPQRLYLWTPPTRLAQVEEPATPRANHDVLHSLRGVQYWFEYAFVPDLPRWWVVPDEPLRTDHAKALYAHRQYAVTVAPPQRLWAFRQPQQTLAPEDLPKQPSHSLHAYRSQAPAAAPAPQRLWYWQQPQRVAAEELPQQPAANLLHAFRSPVASAPQRLWFWRGPLPQQPDFAELARPSHNLHAYRGVRILAPPHARLWFWLPPQRLGDPTLEVHPRHSLDEYRLRVIVAHTPGKRGRDVVIGKPKRIEVARADDRTARVSPAKRTDKA